MDYEQKYKDGLECIQEILNGGSDSIKMSRLKLRLQPFFPELNESEDEKIRKAIAYCIMQGFIGYGEIENVTVDACLAWLEKQGEQKPKWTEEDSSMQLMLMRDIEQVSFISKEGKDERIMWLNKLDDRFHQNTNDIQKSKWTEEDERFLNDVDFTLFQYKDMPKEKYWEIINWLRTIKQRMKE